MSGFFSKIFGRKKTSIESPVVNLLEDVLDGLFSRAGLDLQSNITSEGAGDSEVVRVNLSGADSSLLVEREGVLLDSIQLFVKRTIQHQLPDARAMVDFDCDGYREEANKGLIDLADKLKEKALEQGRSVYLRALSPKDRKVVHQHLASDHRVKSRSIGDGLYKKIKIYPIKLGVDDANRSDV